MSCQIWMCLSLLILEHAHLGRMESQEIHPNKEGISSNNATGSETPKWFMEALKDIAYYLRAHKFNEFDRRYETDPEAAKRSYYKEFPRPPLRALHWEVHKFCDGGLVQCVEYLMKKVVETALKRKDDTVYVMVDQNWSLETNRELVEQVDAECKRLRGLGDRLADPFLGPLERFQWRVTASYYMCWFTMQELPELAHFHEPCDNFANCLDADLNPWNNDFRADDSIPFSCALYSFCPDPCCPRRHTKSLESCWSTPENPCFFDSPGERQCSRPRALNTNLRDLVLGRWNVSCVCWEGYEWNSLYGMCIDVDECSRGHNCDQKLEACVNLPGGFRCACKWGHTWSEQEKRCRPSPALPLIKLSVQVSSSPDKEEAKAQSIVKWIGRWVKGSAMGAQRSISAFIISQLIMRL